MMVFQNRYTFVYTMKTMWTTKSLKQSEVFINTLQIYLCKSKEIYSLSDKNIYYSILS